MTHKEYAEKAWEDARCAFAEGALDCGGTEEAVFVIAAALEKQREACAEAYTAWHNKWNRDWFMDQVNAILNAEVKE